MMKQAKTILTLSLCDSSVLHFVKFFQKFSKNIFILFFALIWVSLYACKSKTEVQAKNESEKPVNQSSAAQTAPASSGFPSLLELKTLLSDKPEYAGFSRLLDEENVQRYINVSPMFDFAILIPSEKNQDPEFLKKYLSVDSKPMDKITFFLNHLSVASKGIPYEGNPTTLQLKLTRKAQVLSYDGGSTNITSERTLKDGTQIIFIDKPIAIPIRK